LIRAGPGALAPLQPAGLWVRRVFTRGFLADDLTRLGGIRYNPHTLTEADRLLTEFFAWAAALPQGTAAAAPRACPAANGARA
jgi:hypothetical protein